MERTIANPIPSPLLLGREKLVEQVFVHFRVNAGAVIAHA
jgi:hypothetical protein